MIPVIWWWKIPILWCSIGDYVQCTIPKIKELKNNSYDRKSDFSQTYQWNFTQYEKDFCMERILENDSNTPLLDWAENLPLVWLYIS